MSTEDEVRATAEAMDTDELTDYAVRAEARAQQLGTLVEDVSSLADDVSSLHVSLTSDLDLAALARVPDAVDLNTTRSGIALAVSLASTLIACVALFAVLADTWG